MLRDQHVSRKDLRPGPRANEAAATSAFEAIVSQAWNEETETAWRARQVLKKPNPTEVPSGELKMESAPVNRVPK